MTIKNEPQPTVSAAIDPADILALFRRYGRFIAVNVAVFITIFLAVAFVLPKKYKSSTTITIYTKYFQNPLVKDFLPELYDTSELKAQRENLIRQAFTDEYLTSIGEKYHLLKSAPASSAREVEIEGFRKNIEIFPLQATSFELGVIAGDKYKTYDLAKELLEKVIDTLAEQRRNSITRVRDSIQRRVEAISLNGSSTGAQDPLATGRPELLRREIITLQQQLQALQNQYTPQHPKVTRLRNRIVLLQGWLAQSSKGTPLKPNALEKPPALLNGESKAVTVDVYEDLLKKLNYLNILLDMEREGNDDYVAVLSPPTIPTGAIWPNKFLFLAWGALTGLLISTMIILAKEYFERSTISMRSYAEDLQLPYLGAMPKFQWSEFQFSKNTKEKEKKEAERFKEWN